MRCRISVNRDDQVIGPVLGDGDGFIFFLFLFSWYGLIEISRLRLAYHHGTFELGGVHLGIASGGVLKRVRMKTCFAM